MADLPNDNLVIQPNPFHQDLERQRSLLLSGLMGLVTNPQIDRLRSGESQPQVNWNAQGPIPAPGYEDTFKKTGRIGPGDTSMADMIVGGLTAPLNFVGGGEGALAHAGGGMASLLAHTMLPGAAKAGTTDVEKAIVKSAFSYLKAGGPKNTEEKLAFLANNLDPDSMKQLGAKIQSEEPELWKQGSHYFEDFMDKPTAEDKAIAFAPSISEESLMKALEQAPPAKKMYKPSPVPTQEELDDIPNLSNLSEASIMKALEKDPGASIFDIAGSKIKGWQEKVDEVLTLSQRRRAQDAMRQLTLSRIPQEESLQSRMGTPEQQALAEALGFNQPAYHGTSAKVPFEAFKLPEEEVGVHFGTKRAAGDRIGVRPDESADFVPLSAMPFRNYLVNIKAQNPLALPDLGTWYLHRMVEGLKKHTTIPLKEINAAESIGDIRDLIHKHGYDSIAYVNEAEHPGSVSFVKMKPNEIRSPFAKYKDLSSDNLLAGLMGFGVVAPAVMQGKQNGQ